MDEESDEELEDRDEMLEPRAQSSSSSEDKDDDAEETEVAFRATGARGFVKFEFHWTSKWR